MTGFLLSIAVASLLAVPVDTSLSAEALLPPHGAWDGASRRLAAASDSLWVTPSEARYLLSLVAREIRDDPAD